MPLDPSSDARVAGANKHLEIADGNLAHVDVLRATGRTDPLTVGWAVTAIFYASVHEVRAYLRIRHDREVSSHEEMTRCFREYPELKSRKADYDLLKEESHSARYYGNKHFSWTDVDDLLKVALRIRNTWRPKTERDIRDLVPS